MAEKPTKIEKMPPMISQPRLFERSFAAEDEADSFAMDRGIYSMAGYGNSFLTGHFETPQSCRGAATRVGAAISRYKSPSLILVRG